MGEKVRRFLFSFYGGPVCCFLIFPDQGIISGAQGPEFFCLINFDSGHDVQLADIMVQFPDPVVTGTVIQFVPQ